MSTCATCGIDLTPVSLLTAVLVTDMTDTGEAVTLAFGRACGDAAALLGPAATAAHRSVTGAGAPAHEGRGVQPPEPGAHGRARRPVDPDRDTALTATALSGEESERLTGHREAPPGFSAPGNLGAVRPGVPGAPGVPGRPVAPGTPVIPPDRPTPPNRPPDRPTPPNRPN